MDIIKTGIGITKTIKNVSRLKHILLTFGKHGFSEFMNSQAIKKVVPDFVLPSGDKETAKLKDQIHASGTYGVIGYRLRLCFEELGPAFIKFGQLLSTRQDLFDEQFIKQMQLLRDKVAPIEFSEVKEEVEKSLGSNLDDIFEYIEDSPLGTASIGVAYKGKLKTGEEVVLKVKRPGIDTMISTDFSIFIFVVSQLEKFSEEIKFLGLSRALKDFEISLSNELNFYIEALNCERLQANFEASGASELFYLPKFYKEYSRRNMLVMEYIDGIPFTDRLALSEHEEELKEKLEVGLKYIIKNFLTDGFFHADLHGGNFFYLPDQGKVALIDFGLMGSLSPRQRESFIALIYSIITYNYETLVYEFLDVAEFDSIPNVDQLISDVRDALSPFVGLTVQQTDFSLVLKACVEAMRKHQIFLPREWYVVFRALITLDGVGKNLGIDFDLFKIFEEDISELVSSSFSKEYLVESGAWLARDFLNSTKMLPRHIKWFLKEWSKKKYAIELIHTGHEQSLNRVTNAIVFLGFSFMAGIILASTAILLTNMQITSYKDIPTMVWIAWGLGFFLFMRGSMFLWRK